MPAARRALAMRRLRRDRRHRGAAQASIHVVRVPETLVRIDPRWHGYLYFVVADQVVIVNPRDMRIVAVLEV